MRLAFAIWSTLSSLLLCGCASLPPVCMTRGPGTAVHVRDRVWFEGRMPHGDVGVLFLFTVELGAPGTDHTRRQRSITCYKREPMPKNDSRFPRSERTMHPTSHTRPLKGERFDKAKEAEAARRKHDRYYISADEARSLPPEAQDLPEIRDRIEHSRHDWPENKAVASVALGPLEGGEGETTINRDVEAASIFEGGQVPASDSE